MGKNVHREAGLCLIDQGRSGRGQGRARFFTTAGISRSVTRNFTRRMLPAIILVLLLLGMTTKASFGQSVGDYRSAAQIMNWSSVASWEQWDGNSWVAASSYPGQMAGTGAVAIRGGQTITLDVSPAFALASLTVESTALLQYESDQPRTLSVDGMITIQPAGIFRSSPTGSVITHQLIARGSILNNGTLDFSTNNNAAGAGITFLGAGNAVFDLSGATLTNLRDANGVLLDKGAYVLSYLPGGTFQVRSANANGFLTIQSGIFSLMGENAFANPVFYATTGSYLIPEGGGFRLDNPQATVVGMYGSLTNSGELIVRRGTYNLGTGAGNEILITNTGRFLMSGGTMNISGRFRVDGGDCTITGGTMNLSIWGHSDQTRAAFYASDAADLAISGDPLITLAFPNSNTTPYNDVEIVAGAGTKILTGGTFQLGTPATPSIRPFLVNSDVPLHNLVVFNPNTTVSLTDHLVINNQLTLNGRLLLNNYNLDLGTADIAGAPFGINAGMIVTGYGTGEVRKTIDAVGSYLFPVGNTSGVNAYLPVTLDFTNGTFTPGATVSVSMVRGIHPQNRNTTNYLNRYWKIRTTGITNPVYNFTGSYANADLFGSEAYMTTGVYTTLWKKLSGPNAVTNTITILGLTENVDVSLINDLAPVITITPVSATICSGSSVALTATATGDVPLSYLWTPAAGLSGTTQLNPVASPAVTTIYTLTVTDGNGITKSRSVTVTVNPLPTATVTGDISVCRNATPPNVTFTGSSGTPPYTFTYQLNGGANQTVGSIGNIVHVPVPTGTSGTFVYTLVGVKDASSTNCSQNQIGNATVTVYPLPVVTANSNSPLCPGQALQLGASPGASYQWTGPNGWTSNQQNPTIANISMAASGTYTVTVTDAHGCSAAASTSVLVNPAPIVSISASPGTTLCSGSNVTFSSSVLNAGINPAYQWRINGVPVAGAVNPTFSSSTLANSQQVSLQVTAHPAYCSATVTSNVIPVTVNPPLIPTVTIEEPTNNICAGTMVRFSTISINGGTAPVYQWKINGADVPGATNATFSTSNLSDGDRVSVSMTSNATCASPITVSSQSVTMVINPLLAPQVSVSAIPSTSICPGTPVTFTASPTNGGSNPTYQWSVNGLPAGSNSPTFISSTLANNDVVRVRMTSNAPCASPSFAISDGVPIIVKPGAPAIPGIIGGNTVVCPLGSQTYTIAPVPNASSYTWTVPTGWNIVEGENTTSINVISGSSGQNGIVSVTASNSCGTSGERILAVSVGSESVAPVGITVINNNTCYGTTKTLTVSGGSLGTGATWQWYTGSCGGTLAGIGTSLTVNPAAGTQVTYWVRGTGTCGTTSCAEATVTVLPAAPSQPGIMTGITPVCPGTTDLIYSVPAVPDATAYQWNLPSGWTGTSTTNTITVSVGAGAASGNISVVASNSCGSSLVRNMSVTVSAPIPATPVAIVGLSERCLNQAGLVYSVAAVPNATSYVWTLPSGWTGSSTTNSITVATTSNATNGNMTVAAVNSCGTSNVQTLPVIVNTAVPVSPEVPKGPTSICDIASGLVFTVPPVANATRYNWQIPPVGWTITSGIWTNTITVFLTAAALHGDQNINVTAVNACGSSAPGPNLQVAVGAFATANAGMDQTICFNTPEIIVNGLAGGAANKNKGSWSTTGTGTFGDALKPGPTTYSPSIADRNAGTVTLTFTTEDPAGSCNAATDYLVLSIRPTPVASISSSNVPICSGSSSTIIFTGTPNTIVTYSVSGVTGNATINLGASGTASLTTPTLTSTTTYGLVSVAYSNGLGCVQTVSGSATVTVNQLPTVNAGGPIVTCESAVPSAISLSGATIGGTATTGTWSIVSGGGTLSNTAPTNTPASVTYTPEENFNGNVVLALTTNAPEACSIVSANRTITIHAASKVNAGGPDVVCQSASPSTILLTGATLGGGAATGAWTIVSGGGTLSSLAQTASPAAVSYTPAFNFIGEVILALTTNVSGACPVVTATRSITVNAAPTVNAGGPDRVCQSESPSAILLTGAVVGGGAATGAWSVISGGGTLSSTDQTATPATVTYTPAANYYGPVLLSLTTNDPDGPGPCTAINVTRSITINRNATVSAGGPDVVCQSVVPLPITLTGAGFTGATTAAWSVTSGGGTLSKANQTALPATVTYTPAPSYSGTVILTLTTNDPDGAGPCNSVSASRTITVNPAATVDAGPGQTICQGNSAILNGAVGGGASYGTWQGGSGIFNPGRTTLNATYTPTTAEINAGSLILTLLAEDPSGPCVEVSATTTLTFRKAVIITTQPSNTGACASNAIDISVVAIGDDLTYQWYKGIVNGGIPITNSGNISGAQSSTLHFNQVSLVDDGPYYVVVSGAEPCTSVTSNEVTLNVNAAIAITTQPVPQTACIGTDVSYTVNASSNGAPLNFQWRKNGVNILGAILSTFTINDITQNDAGNYDVIVTGQAGFNCSSVQSNVASLKVNEDATILLSSGTGTDHQTKCISTPLTNIDYRIGGGGTGASITEGSLPEGVTSTYNAGTKVLTISGTPKVTGSYGYTFTTTGLCLNHSVSGTITVEENSTIVLSSVPGTNNQRLCINTLLENISYKIGGSATGAVISSGALPAGVSFEYNEGTKVFTISGTPIVSGLFNFTVTTVGPCTNTSLKGTILVDPNSTISLSSSAETSEQMVCIHSAIINIAYSVGGSATGVTSANLPPGVSGSYQAGVYTLSGTPNTAGTYPFILTTTGPCSNSSISGTITVNPMTVGGVIAPGQSTVCTTTNEGTLNLSGYTGRILRWESSIDAGVTWTTIANTTNTHQFTNLQLTTFFRAVVQSGVCSEAYSLRARVSVIPMFTPTISATTIDLCAGGTTTLTALTDILQPIGAFTGGGFNVANPEGWRVYENGLVISPFPAAGDNRASGPWAETNGPRIFNGITYDTSDNSKFTIVNGAVNSTLETPVFSLFGLPSAALVFKQAYHLLPGTTAKIELSTDGGKTYNIDLASYTGSLSTGSPNVINPVNIDMSPFLDMINLRIRFSYVSTTGSGWALDGIEIPGQQANVSYTWSPAESLYPPTGSVVSAIPGATTTYTLTMNISGCPRIATAIVINVAHPPTVYTTNACIGGGPVIFTQTGGTLGGSWTVSGGGIINSMTGEFTPSVPGCFTATYTTSSGSCSDTKSFVVFPAAPMPVVNMACNEAIVVTPITAIPGFTLQYSFDDGATWGTSTPSTAENCDGYRIKTRYITRTVCGTAPAGGQSIIVGCSESPSILRVIDLTAPTASNLPAITLTGCNGTFPAPDPLLITDEYDNCNIRTVAWVSDGIPTLKGCLETILRTYRVTDACDKTIFVTQELNRTVDTVLPVITCLTPNTVDVPADLGLTYASNVNIPSPVVWDNCSDTPLLTWTSSDPLQLGGAAPFPANNRFNIGTPTTITWRGTDACGNFSTCIYTVTVIPNDPPDITCADDVTQNTDANLCIAKINPVEPTVNRGDPVNWSWQMTGAITTEGIGPIGDYTFPVGKTTISWKATNISGSDLCIQTITVIDNQPPDFIVPGQFIQCVENLNSAIYNPTTMDINPARPDWYILPPGITLLDITGLNDNCCDPKDLIIHWTIDFSDSHPDISGTGQPSEYDDPLVAGFPNPITLWGTTDFSEIKHTITYTVADCKNPINTTVKSQTITIQPRPNLTKGN